MNEGSRGALSGIEKLLWKPTTGQVVFLGGEACVAVVASGRFVALERTSELRRQN